jgi:beta-N-acetylhexosaminidase
VEQIMFSFEGTTPPAAILDGVRRGAISAFCLFGHWNVESPAQLRALNEMLLHAARAGGQPPPIIGIDQEGGQLIAVTGGATELPGNMALGATRSPELAEQAGRVLGRELRAMGLNMNFAPSLDVNTNPHNLAVGTRSFGADPALVAELGAALIRGMQAEGVMASAKHFPGHGDTSSDSHYAAPVVAHSLEHMEAVELRPFRAAIAAGVAAIMPAHIMFPALDADQPATLSPRILRDFLRGQMGFGGLIVSDAMDMYAVARFGPGPSVRMALDAGIDLVLLAHLPDQLALADSMQAMTSPESVARIRRARAHIPTTLPDLDVVGCAEHQRIAQTIAERAITLVRDGGQLPLRPAADATIAVITAQPRNLTPADTSSRVRIVLADAIRRRHPRVMACELPHPASPDDISAVLKAVAAAEIVVVGTISADQDAAQAALVRELHGRGKRPIVVALRTPYDLSVFPMIETYLCAYSILPVAVEAVARALFGEITPQGVLPCPIPDLPTS